MKDRKLNSTVGKERFLALDAVRGVAALAVLVLHLSSGILPHRGYLAVDVFFVLSGFVIAHAYESRLLAGLSVGKFALLRAIRLYPLVQVGILISVSINVALQLSGHSHLSFSFAQVVFGALLLPYITAASVDMYLVLSPTWSLFNELVINVLYSAVAKVLSNRFLVICCASAAMILFPATLLNGSIEFGPYRGTLLMGLVRTIFSFSYGVLIYRFRSKRVMEHGLLPLSMILATTIALFAVGDVGGLNGLYDALAVTLVIPAVIAVTAHVRISGLFAKAAALLGDLSYPVYILHWPLRLALFATGMQTRLPEAVFLSASAVIICLFAWVVTRLYDEPARKLLQRKLVRGATLPTHPVTVP